MTNEREWDHTMDATDAIPETREDGEIVEGASETTVTFDAAALTSMGEASERLERELAPNTAPPARPILDRIQACERECQRTARVMAAATSEAKVAKEEYAEALERLRAAACDSFQADLPFAEKPPAPSEKGEDWRDVPLSEALQGVSAAILGKLEEAELATVGQLADYTAKASLTDIPAIGAGKAEKIESALEAFWARRKVAGLDPEDEATEEGGEE